MVKMSMQWIMAIKNNELTVEEQGIVRARIADEPLHCTNLVEVSEFHSLFENMRRSHNILLCRNLHIVRRVVLENDNISFVVSPACVIHEI